MKTRMIQRKRSDGVTTVNQAPEGEFVSTIEAAEILQLHPETVREMLRRGDLEGIKTGSAQQCQWRVSRALLRRRSAD